MASNDFLKAMACAVACMALFSADHPNEHSSSHPARPVFVEAARAVSAAGDQSSSKDAGEQSAPSTQTTQSAPNTRANSPRDDKEGVSIVRRRLSDARAGASEGNSELPDPVDLQAGCANFGDEGLYAQLLQAFRDETLTELKAEIDAARTSKRVDLILSALEKLKDAAGYVGVDALSSLCLEAHQRASNVQQQGSEIEEGWNKFVLNDVEKVLREITRVHEHLATDPAVLRLLPNHQTEKERKEEAEAEARKEKERKERMIARCGRARVLCAEDNHFNATVVRAFLKCTEMTMTVVENGKLCFEAYTADAAAFDVILMDLQMPVMDGFEASVQIREWERARAVAEGVPVPIIALTAYAVSQERQKALESGMDFFLTKPLSKFEVLETIGDMLEKRKCEL